MKLVTFEDGGERRIGVVLGDNILDLSRAAPGLPKNMLPFLNAGENAMATLHAAVVEAQRSGGMAVPLKDATLFPPVPRPGKILGIGLNYKAHVEEGGRELPKHQIWFNKQNTSVNSPFGGIVKPDVSDLIDYEGELCFVIGKRCKNVPRERAHEVIAGYMVGNDVTVRDWQKNSPTMQIGKSFDSHAPMGPWITTPDEVGDPQNLSIKTWVNGELRQDGNTKDMLFDISQQIEHLTTAFTLEPGDVIFTGTPEGVGFAMDPPGYIKVGDVVRIEIENVGFIENQVVAEDTRVRIG